MGEGLEVTSSCGPARLDYLILKPGRGREEDKAVSVSQQFIRGAANDRASRAGNLSPGVKTLRDLFMPGLPPCEMLSSVIV